MRDKKVLITGGAGYLGSVMTSHFLAHGAHVTCLDNLMYKQMSPLCFTGNARYAFVPGDARDTAKLKHLVSKHDVLIPLAAIVGYPACDKRPEDARTINHHTVVALNELRSQEQQLLYPTTNSGYGATTGEMHCTEDSPLNPISLYGETKAAAERAILEDSKPAVVFRLATVFGLSPRMRLDLLVNDLTFKAVEERRLVLYEKDFMRNFVHIQDVARVFHYAIEHFDCMAKLRLYNVGHPEANMSKEGLAHTIKKYLPGLAIEEGVGNDPDKRNYIVSNQRILDAGFTFEHSLDQGVQELIRAYPLLSLPNIRSVSTNVPH